MSANDVQRRREYVEGAVLRHLCQNADVSNMVIRSDESVPNGYSNVTELYTASWDESGVSRVGSFVLRACAPGRELFYDTPLQFQWNMMESMSIHTDVPVPRLVHFNSGDSSEYGELFVMEAVHGRVPRNGTPPYHAEGWVADLSPAERTKLASNTIKQLATIHALDWRNGFEFLHRPYQGEPGLDLYLTYQEKWYAWAAKSRSFPVVEEALRWLRRRQPTGLPACITWGDARVGNVIFADDLSVAAVLDWEMAALGTPEMDIAWWCLFEELFTAGVVPLEGIPDRDELISEYEQVSGYTLADLHYFDVLSWARMVITCIRMFCPEPEDDVAPLNAPFPMQDRLAGLLGGHG